MYGRYSGYVINLINVPTALSQAISISLVPAVSAAVGRKDWKGVHRQSHTGLRMAFLVGLPASLGMYGWLYCTHSNSEASSRA